MLSWPWRTTRRGRRVPNKAHPDGRRPCRRRPGDLCNGGAASKKTQQDGRIRAMAHRAKKRDAEFRAGDEAVLGTPHLGY
jgi:hypothetical protein